MVKFGFYIVHSTVGRWLWVVELRLENWHSNSS